MKAKAKKQALHYRMRTDFIRRIYTKQALKESYSLKMEGKILGLKLNSPACS
jgi:hypothetical protein